MGANNQGFGGANRLRRGPAEIGPSTLAGVIRGNVYVVTPTIHRLSKKRFRRQGSRARSGDPPKLTVKADVPIGMFKRYE
jgi:hypothetical protein